MTGYQSKKAAAQDKLEDDDTQIYQTELTKLLMESYDKGVADALAETKAALAQEPVAYLCSPDENGLFGLPTSDNTCKDCFPVYRLPLQRPWVGLTAEEATKCCTISAIQTWFNFENALRIKNT